MNDDAILYAVWPGTVVLHDGSERTFNAAELAAAYGITGEPYLTATSELDLPRDPEARLRYIELKPRGDDTYPDMKYNLEDDDTDVAYRPDFDTTHKYIGETDPRFIDPDIVEDGLVGDI